ncbi:MAG: isoaspartyl peptidase/L-asparaginase family protein [Acidobacteriota bacterium]
MTAIVVHGGAGATSPERHDRLREGVRAAADAGDAILAAGGSALDAVVAAVRVLEDDPEFNAGLGSALTRDGAVETDASVMDGATQRVGAVAAVPDLGCAVALARAVLDSGEHAILAGPAAWRFAEEVGLARAPEGSLVTARQLARWRDEVTRGAATSGGTVGACARDAQGHLAAATSTGGIMYKRAGRVGDSPVPGAGTWADGHAAISATGDGEAILRVALARGVAARVAGGMTLRDAAAAGLDELRRVTAGSAGLVAVDARGVVGVQLSATMPVASVVRDGPTIARADSLGETLPPEASR